MGRQGQGHCAVSRIPRGLLHMRTGLGLGEWCCWVEGKGAPISDENGGHTFTDTDCVESRTGAPLTLSMITLMLCPFVQMSSWRLGGK